MVLLSASAILVARLPSPSSGCRDNRFPGRSMPRSTPRVRQGLLVSDEYRRFCFHRPHSFLSAAAPPTGTEVVHQSNHRQTASDSTVRLAELFEWIKYLESGTPEIPIVARGDRQPVPAGGRRDVAVFDGHTLAGLVEQPLLLGPH